MSMAYQRDDLHELAGAQFAGHRPEDAGADGLQILVDEHRRVAVEADVAAVGPLDLAGGADDDGARHLALLHLGLGDGLLDGDHDHVAHRGVAPPAAAQHLDALDALGAAVVGHVEDGLLLDHG
jgi:hypothetical protein